MRVKEIEMKVEVTIEIEIDESVGTAEERKEYIEFELGYCGGVSTCNPYLSEGLEVIDLDISE